MTLRTPVVLMIDNCAIERGNCSFYNGARIFSYGKSLILKQKKMKMKIWKILLSIGNDYGNGFVRNSVD